MMFSADALKMLITVSQTRCLVFDYHLNTMFAQGCDHRIHVRSKHIICWS